MHLLNLISVILLLILAGCGRGRQSATMDDILITVDVTASYPKKELILQDFMDVEYIPLETNNEFVCQGMVQAIGKDIIIVRNRIRDGNIFIFDRNGKSLRKINRMGRGAEEYRSVLGINLDEDIGEIFVNDLLGKNILVYDLYGNFVRNFRHQDGASYNEIYNFDRENLFCHDDYLSKEGCPFVIISKLNGDITKEIQISFEEKKTTTMMLIDEADQMRSRAVIPSTSYAIIPYFDNWILVEPSSDTVYRYSPDHRMTPVLAKTPPIQSMNPETFLFLSILTDRYYFMEAMKKEYDFEKNEGFPSIDLMYDKQEKAIYEYTVYNNDYSYKKQVYMKSRPVNDEIVTWQKIDSDDLLESLEKGHLKGRLKEIAEGLEEESNPVIMLVKHKK